MEWNCRLLVWHLYAELASPDGPANGKLTRRKVLPQTVDRIETEGFEMPKQGTIDAILPLSIPGYILSYSELLAMQYSASEGDGRRVTCSQ